MNPITSHSITPLEELKSLPLHDRLIITGTALLINQGYSLTKIIELANKEGDFTTSSLLEHNHYLIQRLAHWESDHLF